MAEYDPEKWGYWTKRCRDGKVFWAQSFDGRLWSRDAAEQIRNRDAVLFAGPSPEWIFGPAQQYRDGNPFEEKSAATTEVAYTSYARVEVAKGELVAHPMHRFWMSAESVALALHATDPRVLAFVAARGDSVTVERAWACDEGGWRTEAKKRAGEMVAGIGKVTK